MELITEIIPLIRQNDTTFEVNIMQEMDKVFHARNDKATYEGLIKLIQDSDDLKKTIGLEHLAKYKNTAHVNLLFQIIDDPKIHWWNKRQAVWGLQEIDDERILPKLRVLQKEPSAQEFNYKMIIDLVVEQFEKK